jgi:hypothetical protein
MKSLAGKSVGLEDSQIIVGDNQVVRILGRWLYVVKCRKEEQDGNIILAGKSRKNVPVALVLAVGTGCGKGHKVDKKKLGMGFTHGRPRETRVYDKVLLPDCPDVHFFEWSPYGDGDEYWIHEDIAKAVIEE